MEQTTIRVTSDLHKAMESIKASNESFEELLWDLVEPYLELSDETKKDVQDSLSEYKKGKAISLRQVKEEFNFK